MKFQIVDVFAERRYAGNQLAVVRADGTESESELQQIAQEFGFSETVFLLPSASASQDSIATAAVPVRIFTPTEELPFAGHPTLGAAWVLRFLGMTGSRSGNGIVLQEGVGPIRTWFDGDGPDATIWMQQKPPEFGQKYEKSAVAAALGLRPDDVDPQLPVQRVSTGIPFLIVPLTTLDSVQRARDRAEFVADLFADENPVPLFVFARGAEEPGHHLHSRMFAGQYGIAEDPATGSANGCLAGYLVQHRALGDGPVQLAVEQGYEIGRPSVLYLDAEATSSAEGTSVISVKVGGKVRLVAEGNLV